MKNKNKSILLRNLAVFLYIFLPCLLFLITNNVDPNLLVRFFPDDAFYYLQIAYNLSHMGIVSFDGTNSTTGFHPLQLLFVTLVEFFLNKNNTLIFLFLFNFFAIWFNFFLILKALDIDKKIIIYYPLITLPIFTLFLITNSGMESAILLVALSTFYYSLFKFDTFSSLKSLIIGLELGLIFLARLDSIIPMLVFVVYLGYEYLRNKQYKNIFIGAFSGAVIVLPYLMWMNIVQGSIFPISSIVKQTNEKASFNSIIIAMTGGQEIGFLFLIIPIIVALLALILYYRNLDNYKLKIAALISISNIIYLIYIFGFAQEPYRWYLNYCLFSTSISLMIIFDIYFIRLPNISTYLKVGIASLCIYCNVFALNYWSKLDTVSYGTLQMTYRINELVPINSNIAIADSGVVGFFSTSYVHNLDGLANSIPNWNQFLKNNNDFIGYAKKYDIKYLILKDSSIRKIDKSEFKDKLIIIERFKIKRFADETLILLNYD